MLIEVLNISVRIGKQPILNGETICYKVGIMKMFM